MNDLAAALLVSIGDLLAWTVGRIIGRTLRVEPEKAQRIGQIAVAALLVGAGIVVTVLYS